MDGVSLIHLTEKDYRQLVRLLEKRGCPYHTFQLPSQKLLYVVIKGLPELINSAEESTCLLLQTNLHYFFRF